MYKFGHRPVMTAIVATCLGLIPCMAACGDVKPPNPPRTQQDIMKERYHACRDLRGPALKDCLANYVGQRDQPRALSLDPGPLDPPPREPGPPPQAADSARSK